MAFFPRGPSENTLDQPEEYQLTPERTYDVETCPGRISMMTTFAFGLGCFLRLLKWSRKKYRKGFKLRLQRFSDLHLPGRFGIWRPRGYDFQLLKVPREYDKIAYNLSARRMGPLSPVKPMRKVHRWFKRPLRFADWGFRWGFWECILTGLRGTEDPLNGVLAAVMMSIRKGMLLRRRKMKKGRRHRKGGWHTRVFGNRPWRMMSIMMVFEVFAWIPTLYKRFVEPLPIDWEPFDSPLLEDPMSFVRRRAERSFDERNTWVLPFVQGVREKLVGKRETVSIPREQQQHAQLAVERFRDEVSVSVERRRPARAITAEDLSAESLPPSPTAPGSR